MFSSRTITKKPGFSLKSRILVRLTHSYSIHSVCSFFIVCFCLFCRAATQGTIARLEPGSVFRDAIDRIAVANDQVVVAAEFSSSFALVQTLSVEERDLDGFPPWSFYPDETTVATELPIPSAAQVLPFVHPDYVTHPPQPTTGMAHLDTTQPQFAHLHREGTHALMVCTTVPLVNPFGLQHVPTVTTNALLTVAYSPFLVPNL